MKKAIKKVAKKTAKAKPVRFSKKPFAKMSRQERRMAIARDVLLTIALGKLTPKQGTYFEEENGVKKPDFSSCDVKKGHKCEGCAKGGLMLAWMRLAKPKKDEVETLLFGGNGYQYKRSIQHDEIINKLSSDFTHGELDEIEAAFEYWGGNGHRSFSFDTIEDEGKRVTRRMQAIMGNIIRNGGNFVTTKGPMFYAVRLPKRPYGLQRKKRAAKK